MNNMNTDSTAVLLCKKVESAGYIADHTPMLSTESIRAWPTVGYRRWISNRPSIKKNI